MVVSYLRNDATSEIYTVIGLVGGSHKQHEIECQSLRQELAEQEEAIDWKNPCIRNRIKKSMQSIVSVGSVRGSTDRYSPVKLLPKLTPILYHRMVAFYQDDLHTLGRKNGSKKWDPVEETSHGMDGGGSNRSERARKIFL